LILLSTMTQMIPKRIERFVLPIRTEATLRQFIRLAFGVTLPDKQVCANHSTPWRAFCDAYFARSPVSVWKASRGFGGKTFTLALLSLVEALTLRANVSLLGGSGEQSRRALEHTARFVQYRDAPRDLIASEVGRETRLVYGNRIEALMASQASVRGPHPQRLRIDEVDEVDLAILDASLGQPMSADGIAAQTTLSSTHQYADGTMTEILRRAAEKGWSVHEWCWRETIQPHGWLPEAEVNRKRLEVSDTMWRVEYDLQEPSPESRAIEPRAVGAMFRRELGEFAGGVREYIEIEPPQAGAQYATGADWARKQDWTVIVTLRVDCKPMRLVAFERLGRESWDAMIARFDERVRRFGGAALHDGTGLGDVIAEQVIGSGAQAFLMVGRERANLLSEYIAAIERGEIESPMIRFMESEHRLASVDDVYGVGHLPDTISAAALAYRAARLYNRLQSFVMSYR